MIRTNKIKALIVENNLTQEIVAKKLGISPKTFSNKLKNKKFNSDEMYLLIDILNIKNPSEIFFGN